METAKAFLVGAAFILGLLIVFYTLFSYEDEEKKMKSWFETAWIALKEKDQGIAAGMGEFLRKLLNGLNGVFARIYGAQLISIRAIAVSICLVFVIPLLLCGLNFKFPWYELWWYFGIATICLIAPFPRRNWPSYVACVLVLLFFVRSEIVIAMRAQEAEEEVSLQMTGVITLAIAFESLLIMAIRKSFMLAANAVTLRGTMAFIFAGTLVVPIYLLFAASLQGIGHESTDYGYAAAVFSVLNIVPTVTSLSYLAVLLIAVVLRVIYALLPRALYAPIKLKLLDNRKVASALGIALMGISMPTALGFMKEVAKTIGLG